MGKTERVRNRGQMRQLETEKGEKRKTENGAYRPGERMRNRLKGNVERRNLEKDRGTSGWCNRAVYPGCAYLIQLFRRHVWQLGQREGAIPPLPPVVTPTLRHRLRHIISQFNIKL